MGTDVLTRNRQQFLTDEQLEQYQEEGYFVVRALYDRAAVAEMIEECESILRGDYGDLYQGAVSLDPGSREKIQAERKIAAVVERSEVFRRRLLQEELLLRAQEILGPDILLFRDILMLKPAQVGSKMPWHQDSNYWPIDPPELCSVWTALDPATIENGCMRVVPRSHHLDLIASTVTADGRGPVADEQVDLDKAIDVEMAPGDSLFFHSRLLHGSEPNHSDKPRRAFIASLMSAQSTRNNSPGDNRQRYFLVSGQTFPGCVRN